MLDVSFSQLVRGKSELLDLTFAQAAPFPSSLLDLAFSQKRVVQGGLLDLAFSQFDVPSISRFKGEHAVNMQDFDVRVSIDGKLAPLCDLTDTMKISHGENEAYLCTFVLLHPHERKNPQPISLEKWYTKDVIVELVSRSGSLKVYQGRVVRMGVNPFSGRFEIMCSDNRELQINRLPRRVIKQVGYTSISAHGNEFETQAQELEKRLETVPASFEFDVNGTPYLTPWREKETADFIITPCMIYQREPKIEVASVGGVLNQVSYTVRINQQLLRQRVLRYTFDSGLGVCDYARYRTLPTVKEIEQAVEQTGWKMGWRDFVGVEPSGWYRCNGKMMGFIRDHLGGTLSEDGNKFVSRSRKTFDGVKSGHFDIVKRWTQSIAESYTITLLNQQSIDNYELNSEKMSFDVAFNEPESHKNWESSFEHQQGHYLQLSGSAWRWHGKQLQQQQNGDWVLSSDWQSDVADTLRVAYWTAYTKMLASHRNNTVDFDMKLLPEIDLRHTHQINHSHFSGKCKVGRFEHTFLLKQKRAQTQVQYRFFRNPEFNPAQLSQEPSVERIKLNYPQYNKSHYLGRVELPKNELIKNQQGMIYRLAARQAFDGSPLFVAAQFRIHTPEIESASTDASEQKQAQQQQVNIYHTPVEIRV